MAFPAARWLLDDCLARGQWMPAAAGALDFTGYCWTLSCRHRCPHVGARAQSVWRGNATECATLLPSEMNASYSGAFAQPIDLFLIGDSVTWQIGNMITWATQHNPHLARLRVTQCSMPIIPRSRGAVEDALQECIDSGSAHSASSAATRAIIVNIGLWYLPTPWCAPAHMQASPACVCCREATMNETHPTHTARPTGYVWDDGPLYSAMRRYTGTNLVAEHYVHDAALLAEVLHRWRRRSSKGVSKVVWLASSPQHFPPDGVYDVAHLRLLRDQPLNFNASRPSFHGSCLAEVPSRPQIRNDRVLPLVRSKGGGSIRIVNAWEPLRIRGDMHKEHDCTHFCEPGDAVWLLASTALASLAVE